MTKTPNEKDDNDKKRDEVLKRMLNTPPKPRKPKEETKREPKGSRRSK